MVMDATKLKVAIAEREITIRELADKANLPSTTVSRIIRGSSPSLRTLGKLAKALNVPVEDMVVGFSQKKSARSITSRL